jgi:lysophospholipase L1-like esterase
MAAAGYNEYVLGPSAILGQPIDPGKSVVGVVGDSIVAGTGDFQVGWVQRLLNGNYSFQKVAYPGEGVGLVYATTCTPQTTSTDGWVTVINQTVANAGKETKRVQYNDWLRDGAPTVGGVAVAVGTNPAVRAGEVGHPLFGFIEVATLAESGVNSGLWKAGYTDDGTHPNSVGAAGIAAGLNAVTLFGAVSTA